MADKVGDNSGLYDHKKLDKHWQKVWKKEKLYKSSKRKGKKYYLLVELAYSSGDLHIGHWFSWAPPDVLARMKRMQGFDVLFPVGGFDSFGLPAENAAIKHKVHPKEWTNKNIANMRRQYETMGPSFDWESEVITSDVDYYRWTQWLFLQLLKNGLAYRAEVTSNWCPKCKTVLANEHVVNGCCWRHEDTEVVQKKVPQWLVKITKYADELIWSENPKADWPKSMRKGQNDWIGRSEGILIKFPIFNFQFSIKVFTTRPDTLWGATFMILAPEHPLALKITATKQHQKVKKYIENAKKRSERDRLEDAKKKTGVFTGAYAQNPLSNQKMPIWISDFVLMDYGTGAIMGVPAHDERDWEFAKQNNLTIRKVISGGDVKKKAYVGEGKLVNSGKYSGINSVTAIKKITADLVSKKLAKKDVQYHLRDWSISRQRYWGAPIPVIYCEACGIVPVDEKDLPVELPTEVDYNPTGKAPLGTAEKWVKVACPECGESAKRETETMDTYVDSSWYFFRYPDPRNSKEIFDKKKIKQWMPVKVYFGGNEHTLGHTLYARFITKFLHVEGMIDFDEFALKRFNHGIILGTDGQRMSKSRGNVVNPDEEVRRYGADAVRLYICFMGPHDSGAPWKREGIEGASRFLDRVWRLVTEQSNFIVVEKSDAEEILRIQHKTVQKVTKDIEGLQFNTAVSSMMEFVNLLRSKVLSSSQANAKRSQRAVLSNSRKIAASQSPRNDKIRCAEWDEALRTLMLLLAPFAPHIAEELFQRYYLNEARAIRATRGTFSSIHLHPWPKFDPELIKEDIVTIPVQVNGKLRSTLTVDRLQSTDKKKIIELAKADQKVSKWLKGKQVKKEIFVPGKLVNFVV